MKFLRISIITRMERNTAISKVREAISECGGWIVNHALFSNMMANINFEIPFDSVDIFIGKLEQADLKSIIDGEIPEGKGGDLRGQISLSFIHKDPDLKRDVPAFG